MKKIFILLFSIFLISCTKDKPQCCVNFQPVIFKLQDTSYINYIPVCKKGTCFPGSDYKVTAMKVHKDYFLDNGGFSIFGTNTALLNVTVEEYKKLPFGFNYDSLRRLALTEEPFVEVYVDEKNILWHGKFDTARLNQIIDSCLLDKYFTKIKLN